MRNTKMLHMGAPIIKEDVGAAKKMGRVPSEVVIREGFLEEEASKHSLA